MLNPGNPPAPPPGGPCAYEREITRGPVASLGHGEMRERGARGGRDASALRGGKRRGRGPESLVEASCLRSMIRGRLDIQEERLVARADEKARAERKSRSSSGHSGDALPLYRRPTRSRVSRLDWNARELSVFFLLLFHHHRPLALSVVACFSSLSAFSDYVLAPCCVLISCPDNLAPRRYNFLKDTSVSPTPSPTYPERRRFLLCGLKSQEDMSTKRS